jgi:hypothetical protein
VPLFAPVFGFHGTLNVEVVLGQFLAVVEQQIKSAKKQGLFWVAFLV